MRQAAGIQHRVFVAHLFDLVYQRHIEGIRHETRAKTLYFVWCGFERFAGTPLGEYRAGVRLNRNRGDGFAPGMFEVARYAGNRSAGTNTRHKNIDFAVGIVPDFRAGSLFMDSRVGRVFELLQQDIFWVGNGDLLGLGDRTTHAFAALGQYQCGTESDQQFAPFDAHGFRHGQGERNAARSGDKSQRNAGVAAGRFDKFFARTKQAAFFGIPDHRRADAAFDRIGGIASFDFGEDGGGRAVGNAIKAHQRGAAYGQGVVLVPICHGYLRLNVSKMQKAGRIRLFAQH